MTTFKLDTGADVTVIPDSLFIKTGAKLKATKARLTGPGQYKLHVLGVIDAKLTAGHGREITQQVYIVKDLKSPLLGRPAIQALSLLETSIETIQKNSTSASVFKEYPELFNGLGRMTGEYHMKLKECTTPYAVLAPRRVAVPLLPKVKAELERLENQGVISKVNEPTEWCAPMVVVPKPNADVRICVDLTKLNGSVCRERHILPSVEQILAQLNGAKIFSKLDANSGFHQIRLDKESTLLTTFITTYDRFCYNRLPFGITSAPEHFQRRMSEILSGLPGTLCLIDDTLVYGSNQEEHDERLKAALDKIKAGGLTLNKEKCQFSQEKVTFLGQVTDATGIRPDPKKVKAIVNMKEPTDKSELRRFLGMVNQLNKFSQNQAEISKPLRDLLSIRNEWHRGHPQQKAFEQLKKELSDPGRILVHYNPGAETIVSADASPYGLGAVLTQLQDNGEWRPVTYHSRSMSDAEKRYP